MATDLDIPIAIIIQPSMRAEPPVLNKCYLHPQARRRRRHQHREKKRSRLLVGIGGHFNAEDTKRRKSSAAAWPSTTSTRLYDEQKDGIGLRGGGPACGEQLSCTKAGDHGQPDDDQKSHHGRKSVKAWLAEQTHCTPWARLLGKITSKAPSTNANPIIRT
ncbi:hypothetical protein AC579_2966 [Pseudocercospora musae]|uniref:Uncharacterized protein n=1 Tax=Pseudocercospora musae TaxID=113226 RepID=A0A139I7X7_9PEZI|nr:hypothetical protein AC579_2966 [Pseudocercospora musae]